MQVPQNGLVIYTGTVMTDDGKEKKMSMAIEPFKPINISLYLCDSKFHTEVSSKEIIGLFCFVWLLCFLLVE
jgi:peptide chain release factor subunit 1